jgi:hypothetical protein
VAAGGVVPRRGHEDHARPDDRVEVRARFHALMGVGRQPFTELLGGDLRSLGVPGAEDHPVPAVCEPDAEPAALGSGAVDLGRNFLNSVAR